MMKEGTVWNIYMLVFPSEVKLKLQKISVLAPIGTAIFGCGVGDTSGMAGAQ